MIDQKVFSELQNHGIVTQVGIKADDFKNLDELKKYGIVTAIGANEVYEQAVAATNYVESFFEEIAAGGLITLDANISIDKPIVIEKDVTVDLNGYNISSSQDVFEVKSGTLVIEGNGKLHAATDNTCSWCAVYANGQGNVIINGGEYIVGAPEGDYNDLIYAKDNATITINGGKFHIAGTVRANDGVSFMLNLKDNTPAKIEVKGGLFEKSNPSAAKTEPGDEYNFVANGYESIQEGDWFVVKPIEDIVVDDNE